jgi:hypothetical protein
MKYSFILIILCCLLLPFLGFPQQPAKSGLLEIAKKYKYTPYSPTEVRLTAEELNLYDRLMNYRKSKGKAMIPLSRALSYVARIHTADLTDHGKTSRRFNAHSWSSKGSWSPCVYAKDTAHAGCSWNKPRELTTYKGDGYEMIYFDFSAPTPEAALLKWQKNSTNDNMLLNKGEFENVTWNAVGVGMYGHYAAVWFGKVEDQDGKPDNFQK